jgi:hypothetical protein
VTPCSASSPVGYVFRRSVTRSIYDPSALRSYSTPLYRWMIMMSFQTVL